MVDEEDSLWGPGSAQSLRSALESYPVNKLMQRQLNTKTHNREARLKLVLLKPHGWHVSKKNKQTVRAKMEPSVYKV